MKCVWRLKIEQSTGVTLHQMVEKQEAGPVASQKKVDIAFDGCFSCGFIIVKYS